MKGKKVLSALLLALFVSQVYAQEEINPEDAVTTQHQGTFNGNSISYSATIGHQPVWDKDGNIIAGLNYTYYEKNGVKDKAHRPLLISFNGGPGSGSLWMEIGYTGPVLLNLDAEGQVVQPYGVHSNPYSILDVADIVYICPVNTGFSRIIKNKDKKESAESASQGASRGTNRGRQEASQGKSSPFFGINEDIDYISDWVKNFINRQNRWESPKFIIGESYGTTRASGLVYSLQQKHWIYVNGVILLSPTELGIDSRSLNRKALTLPYMAATSWYHKALNATLQNKDLDEILPEVEKFTVEEYIPALAWGGSLPEARRKEIAKKISLYSGISEQEVLRHNLVIETRYYWKELLRNRDLHIGRLDSRYTGRDIQTAGEHPDYSAEFSTWNRAFSTAYNWYVRNELNYKTDVEYLLFGNVHPWNRNNDHTGEDLGKALSQNPDLKVLVQSGYYDGGCDYFNAKYNFWQIDRGGKFQDRFIFKGYRCGHMIYVRQEDLKQGNEDIRQFILSQIPKDGQAIRY